MCGNQNALSGHVRRFHIKISQGWLFTYVDAMATVNMYIQHQLSGPQTVQLSILQVTPLVGLYVSARDQQW